MTTKLLAVVLSVAGLGLAGCSTSHPSDVVGHPAASSGIPDTVTDTTSSGLDWTEIDATRGIATGVVLVAGRTKTGRTTQVWRCAKLIRPTTCHDISPTGMGVSEYVDDIDVDEFGDYWLLSHGSALARGWLRISRDNGRTWSARRRTPAHNDSAGSKGRIVAFDARHAVVTQFDANGPLMGEYRTNDGGATWREVFNDDFSPSERSAGAGRPGQGRGGDARSRRWEP